MKYVYKLLYGNQNKILYALSTRHKDTIITSPVHSALYYYINKSILFLSPFNHGFLWSFGYINPKLHCSYTHRAGISKHFFKKWANTGIWYISVTSFQKEWSRKNSVPHLKLQKQEFRITFHWITFQFLFLLGIQILWENVWAVCHRQNSRNTK